MVALHPTEAEDTEGWGGWRSKKKTQGGPRAQEGARGNTRALTHGHLKAVH